MHPPARCSSRPASYTSCKVQYTHTLRVSLRQPESSPAHLVSLGAFYLSSSLFPEHCTGTIPGQQQEIFRCADAPEPASIPWGSRRRKKIKPKTTQSKQNKQPKEIIPVYMRSRPTNFDQPVALDSFSGPSKRGGIPADAAIHFDSRDLHIDLGAANDRLRAPSNAAEM